MLFGHLVTHPSAKRASKLITVTSGIMRELNFQRARVVARIKFEQELIVQCGNKAEIWASLQLLQQQKSCESSVCYFSFALLANWCQKARVAKPEPSGVVPKNLISRSSYGHNQGCGTGSYLYHCWIHNKAWIRIRIAESDLQLFSSEKFRTRRACILKTWKLKVYK